MHELKLKKSQEQGQRMGVAGNGGHAAEDTQTCGGKAEGGREIGGGQNPGSERTGEGLE